MRKKNKKRFSSFKTLVNKTSALSKDNNENIQDVYLYTDIMRNVVWLKALAKKKAMKKIMLI